MPHILMMLPPVMDGNIVQSFCQHSQPLSTHPQSATLMKTQPEENAFMELPYIEKLSRVHNTNADDVPNAISRLTKQSKQKKNILLLAAHTL